MEGTYTIKLYFNDILIYEDPTKVYIVKSGLCKDTYSNLPGTSGTFLFKCPSNPDTCANSYYECNYINQTKCPNQKYPFLCNDKCVSNMASECCKINDKQLPDYKWCPHIN